MTPTGEWATGRTWAKALKAAGLCATVLCASVAFGQGSIEGFNGDFAPDYWSATPDAGFIYFTNANSELVLGGAYEPAAPTVSLDPITYNGPLSGGLVVGGTIEFNWQYSSPGFSSDDQLSFAWMPAGGSSSQVVLAFGPGTTNSVFSVQLTPGSTFQFLLFSDTPANKIPVAVTVTNFQFNANVPEPSAGALFAALTALFAASSFRRSRRLRG